MKKRKKGKKLSRSSDQRKALRKSLMSEFFLHGKIKTTQAKAKDVQPMIEKFITIAKKGEMVQKRFLRKFFSSKIVKKIVDEIAPQFKERKGGYTKIIKKGQRKSDGAKIAIIELIK
jgi:large subunit ribosomal protein L17